MYILKFIIKNDIKLLILIIIAVGGKEIKGRSMFSGKYNILKKLLIYKYYY